MKYRLKYTVHSCFTAVIWTNLYFSQGQTTLSSKKSLKVPKEYVIRICKSKDRQHNGQKKNKTKGQTTIYKTHTSN